MYVDKKKLKISVTQIHIYRGSNVYLIKIVKNQVYINEIPMITALIYRMTVQVIILSKKFPLKTF